MMKNIDLNIRTDDLNVNGVVEDDSVPVRIESSGSKIRLVKVIFEGETLEQAQEVLKNLVSKKTAPEIATDLINTVLGLHERLETGPRGERGLLLPEKRKINHILDALEKMEVSENGILELADDHATYLKELFPKVPLEGGVKVMVRVADAIDSSFIKDESAKRK